jgi:hypothetical protein
MILRSDPLQQTLPRPAVLPGPGRTDVSDACERIVTAAYEAALDPDLWSDLAAALASVTAQRVNTILSVIEPLHNIERVVATHNYSPGAVDRYVMHYASVNLFTPAILRAPLFQPVAASAVLDRRIVLASEFYNDFLRPEGTGPGGTAMNVAANARSIVTVWVQYGGDGEPMLDALYGVVMKRVGPHLARAAALAGRAADSVHPPICLDTVPTPALALGETGAVIAANPAAEAVTGGGPLSLGANGQLLAPAPQDQKTLDAAVAMAVAPVPRAGLVRVRSPRRDGDLVLSLLPLRGARRRPRVWTLAGESERAVAVVHIAAERQTRHLAPALERLYGLEGTDAMIAIGLYHGRRLPEIAAALGLSHYEASLRMERVLDRLDVDRVVDLVRRIATLCRIPGPLAGPPG